jgi:hypothetical protein
MNASSNLKLRFDIIHIPFLSSNMKIKETVYNLIQQASRLVKYKEKIQHPITNLSVESISNVL